MRHLLHLLWCAGCRSGRTYWIRGEGCTPKRLPRVSISNALISEGGNHV